MSRRYFVGSSYFDKRQPNRAEFFRLWQQNTARGFPNASRVVIVAEAGSLPPDPIPANYDVIHLSGDLGHVTMLEKGIKPHKFSGWTAHMAALAMLAYCDEADFIYKESDCIAWGAIEDQMYRDLGDGDIVFGRAHRGEPGMPSSQSLFLVRHAFIPDFVSTYLRLGGDAKVYGETKMCILSDQIGTARAKRLAFDGDRSRPIAYDAPIGYAQQISPDELAELQRRNLI